MANTTKKKEEQAGKAKGSTSATIDQERQSSGKAGASGKDSDQKDQDTNNSRTAIQDMSGSSGKTENGHEENKTPSNSRQHERRGGSDNDQVNGGSEGIQLNRSGEAQGTYDQNRSGDNQDRSSQNRSYQQDQVDHQSQNKPHEYAQGSSGSYVEQDLNPGDSGQYQGNQFQQGNKFSGNYEKQQGRQYNQSGLQGFYGSRDHQDFNQGGLGQQGNQFQQGPQYSGNYGNQPGGQNNQGGFDQEFYGSQDSQHFNQGGFGQNQGNQYQHGPQYSGNYGNQQGGQYNEGGYDQGFYASQNQQNLNQGSHSHGEPFSQGQQQYGSHGQMQEDQYDQGPQYGDYGNMQEGQYGQGSSQYGRQRYGQNPGQGYGLWSQQRDNIQGPYAQGNGGRNREWQDQGARQRFQGNRFGPSGRKVFGQEQYGGRNYHRKKYRTHREDFYGGHGYRYHSNPIESYGSQNYANMNPFQEQERSRYSQDMSYEGRNQDGQPSDYENPGYEANEFSGDYDDRPQYYNEGYQSPADTEGFGSRRTHHQDQNWRDYERRRGAHSENRRSHGRYGSH